MENVVEKMKLLNYEVRFCLNSHRNNCVVAPPAAIFPRASTLQATFLNDSISGASAVRSPQPPPLHRCALYAFLFALLVSMAPPGPARPRATPPSPSQDVVLRGQARGPVCSHGIRPAREEPVRAIPELPRARGVAHRGSCWGPLCLFGTERLCAGTGIVCVDAYARRAAGEW